VNNYSLKVDRIYDDYKITLKRIRYAPQINEFPILQPNKLANIQNLTLLLGINNFKKNLLAAIINYINNTQIKRIAIIEDKLSFMYQEKQSIIDILEYNGDYKKLEDNIKFAFEEEYDIIALNLDNIPEELLTKIANYSINKNIIINAEYPDIINFYKSFKKSDDMLLKVLKAYITHKIIKNNLSILEIVYVNDKIKDLIKQGDINKLRDYLLSIEESDIQTFNESIGYLVKEGKLTKEEAIKYISSLDTIDETSNNAQEVEI
jgi:twitching motility protein PilU